MSIHFQAEITPLSTEDQISVLDRCHKCQQMIANENSHDAFYYLPNLHECFNEYLLLSIKKQSEKDIIQKFINQRTTSELDQSNEHRTTHKNDTVCSTSNEDDVIKICFTNIEEDDTDFSEKIEEEMLTEENNTELDTTRPIFQAQELELTEMDCSIDIKYELY